MPTCGSDRSISRYKIHKFHAESQTEHTEQDFRVTSVPCVALDFLTLSLKKELSKPLQNRVNVEE